MPTLAGLRRRGVPPEAIRDFVKRIGVAKANSVVDAAMFDFSVREVLNRTAQRRMAVLRPLKIVIENYPEGQTEELDAVNHPDDASAGSRKIRFSRELYVERDDFMENAPKKFYRLTPGREVRLRYAYFVKCREAVKNAAGEVVELRCTYDPATRGGNTPPDGRKVQATLHWVSAADSVPAEVRLYNPLFADPIPTPATSPPTSTPTRSRCSPTPASSRHSPPATRSMPSSSSARATSAATRTRCPAAPSSTARSACAIPGPRCRPAARGEPWGQTLRRCRQTRVSPRNRVDPVPCDSRARPGVCCAGATGVAVDRHDRGRGGRACAAAGRGAGSDAVGAKVVGHSDRPDAVPAVAAAGVRPGLLARGQRSRAMAVRALRRRGRDGCNSRGNASGGGYASQALPSPDAAPPAPHLQPRGVGPWALLILAMGTPPIVASISHVERFPDTGNPGYFIVKAALWLMAGAVLVSIALDFLGRDGEGDR